MAFTVRRAIRENVPLIIGLAGGTGSGKTLSALKIASGLSGGKPFVGIDSESGRMKHYAADFTFDHGEIHAPFTPDTYLEAIVAVDKLNYPVIVVDSFSHVYDGTGGICEWHDEILAETVERKRQFAVSKGWTFDEWKTREANNIGAWIEPKKAHKKMVQRLLQLRAHLIVCMRAEKKIEIGKDKDGKTEVRDKVMLADFGRDGWSPVCEKKFPFEITDSFLLTSDRPGFPRPVKLNKDHVACFPLDRPISEEAGVMLAAWAHGDLPGGLRGTALRNAMTLTELAAEWAKIPKSQQKDFAAVKDARKAELDSGRTLQLAREREPGDD